MNDEARAVLSRAARTIVSAVRSMQAPDDLPPKSGPSEPTKPPAQPKRRRYRLMMEDADGVWHSEVVEAKEDGSIEGTRTFAAVRRVRIIEEPE